jgi:hypothetical protein
MRSLIPWPPTSLRSSAHPDVKVHCVQDAAPELRALPEALTRALPPDKSYVELIAGQQAELGVVDNATGHRFLVVAREQRAQWALPGDDEGEHEAAVHVEVGEMRSMPRTSGMQFVALVEEEDGLRPSLSAVPSKRSLQATDENRVGAGGLGAAGDGDLAAYVALGQTGDLDVVDVVTGLGEALRRRRNSAALPVPAVYWFDVNVTGMVGGCGG